MKKLLASTLFCAILGLCAESPAPLVHYPLNEGDLTAVKDAGGQTSGQRFFNHSQFSWEDGPAGRALSFNNPDDIKTYAGIMFNLPPAFDPSKGFTVVAKIKTPATLHRSRQYEIFSFADTHSKGPGLRIYISWRMLYLMVGDGEKAGFISSKTSDGAIQPATWYQVAAVYDGKTARIYLDGRLRGEMEFATTTKPKRKYAVIGASGEKGAYYSFQGLMNDVRLYDKPLTADQIIALNTAE